MRVRTNSRIAEGVPAREEHRDVEAESRKLAGRERVAHTIGSDARSIVRDDRFALRMHVEHETAAVGEVDLDLASDVSIAIIGRTNLNREIGRERWPLALKLEEFPKPSA